MFIAHESIGGNDTTISVSVKIRVGDLFQANRSLPSRLAQRRLREHCEDRNTSTAIDHINGSMKTRPTKRPGRDDEPQRVEGRPRTAAKANMSTAHNNHPDAEQREPTRTTSSTTGMLQVLAHFDRIQEIHAEDRELLRAMFVATFEAAKTTSPLRERVQSSTQERRGQGRGGAAQRHRGRLSPIRDRHRSAVRDITAAVFGIAFQWVAVPQAHDLDVELDSVRSRIIRQYGSAILSDATQESLGDPLHAPGEDVTDVAAVVPVQLAAPAFLQCDRGLAHRHPVVPRPDDEPALRRRRGVDRQRIDHRGQLR